MSTLTWASARTLDQVGLLMAAWLEGRITSRPAYEPGYGPDTETTELIPTLAACCRAGFVTDDSQPGYDGPGYDGAHWRQRAAVTGFVADPLLLARILHAARGEGLAVVVDGQPGSLVVTENDGRPHTRYGRRVPAASLMTLWSDLGRAGHTAVAEAHQLTLADPIYGPTQRLWTVLDRVTGRTR